MRRIFLIVVRVRVLIVNVCYVINVIDVWVENFLIEFSVFEFDVVVEFFCEMVCNFL